MAQQITDTPIARELRHGHDPASNGPLPQFFVLEVRTGGGIAKHSIWGYHIAGH